LYYPKFSCQLSVNREQRAGSRVRELRELRGLSGAEGVKRAGGVEEDGEENSNNQLPSTNYQLPSIHKFLVFFYTNFTIL
jgi:hypothetical protein